VLSVGGVRDGYIASQSDDVWCTDDVVFQSVLGGIKISELLANVCKKPLWWMGCSFIRKK
jgi:hypothetical protein